MLDISSRQLGCASGRISRRDFVKVGALGASGLTLANWLKLKAHGQTTEGQTTEGKATEGKAKSVIQLWMGGGPCHIDTFDPKPQAGQDYSGPYRKPVATNTALTCTISTIRNRKNRTSYSVRWISRKRQSHDLLPPPRVPDSASA